MDKNPMDILYRHFGEKPEEGQDMLSISNIFYEMGHKEEKIKNCKDGAIKKLFEEVD